MQMASYGIIIPNKDILTVYTMQFNHLLFLLEHIIKQPTPSHAEVRVSLIHAELGVGGIIRDLMPQRVATVRLLVWLFD